MSADHLFNDKELAVLAQLRANLIKASSGLSKTELSVLPAEADWSFSIEQNGPVEWEAYARSLRRAAYTYQCDPKIELKVQAALSQLAMPIHGRLLRDNTIPVFDEAPDDLVFPEADAELYKQELAALHDELSRLRQQKENAVDENSALLAQIDQLRKDLADEKARVDRLIEQGRGWQIAILSNVRLKIGDISIGGEWWDSAITLIRDKAIRDILIGNLKRTAKAGKQLFSAVAKWGARYSAESIERGAHDRIDSFHQLQKKLDAEAEAAADGNPGPPPPDFDYAEVYERLLSGQPVPAAWAPHVTRLDFGLREPHHLDSDVLQRFSGQENTFARVDLLENLTSLQSLDLWGTQVTNIAPLANLTSLQSLNLRGTLVAGIAPLENLTSLQSLNLRRTQVADISPHRNLASLQFLDLK
ncbi:MAG: leucine-rich repeat domain-containing protein, partial [Parvibaculum sp.]